MNFEHIQKLQRDMLEYFTNKVQAQQMDYTLLLRDHEELEAKYRTLKSAATKEDAEREYELQQVRSRALAEAVEAAEKKVARKIKQLEADLRSAHDVINSLNGSGMGGTDEN